MITVPLTSIGGKRAATLIWLGPGHPPTFAAGGTLTDAEQLAVLAVYSRQLITWGQLEGEALDQDVEHRTWPTATREAFVATLNTLAGEAGVIVGWTSATGLELEPR